MKIYIAFFLMGISGLIFAGNIKNQPEGFRDVKCGIERGSLNGLTLKEYNHDIDYPDVKALNTEKYYRLSDVKKLKHLKLEGISYIFYLDQLLSIEIIFQNAQDFESLYKVLIEEYGEKHAESEMQIIWKFDKVTLGLFKNDGLKLLFYCNDVSSRYYKIYEEVEKKANEPGPGF